MLALLLLLSACAGPAAQATSSQATPAASSAPTPAPTSTPTPVPPSPTAVPALPANVAIAGIDVGGLAVPDARSKLARALAPLLAPLKLTAGGASATLEPSDIALELATDAVIDAALHATPGAQVALELSYDQAQLRAALASLSAQLGGAPEVSVITSTQAISRSFALRGGQAIDIDAAVQQIDAALRAPDAPRTLTLATSAAARPTPEQLQAQIEQIAKSWKDVAGVVVYDLASGEEIASLNKNTVFSAASTIKTAIMLNAYASRDSFTAKQEDALKKMIVNSDNLAANTVLAASVNGSGTDDALKGAEKMSAMLKDLGLTHTYLYVPFEATDYLAQKKVKYKLGPKTDGAAPFTDSGRALRTSPAEMAQLYLLIDQCSKGQGRLIEKLPKLNAKRCGDMLDRLFANADASRMRSGLPRSARVEHKSGWIDDMQADAGIVRSPGGDFVLAVYLYRVTKAGVQQPDTLFAPYLGAFARLVYSYYNPLVART